MKEGGTPIFLEFVAFGVPGTLIKNDKSEKNEKKKKKQNDCDEYGSPLKPAALLEVERVARLQRGARVMYVACVAAQCVNDGFWTYHEGKRGSSSQQDRMLLQFVERARQTHVKVEVHSLALDFAQGSWAEETFRQLDALSRSVVCAAIFNSHAPPDAREKSEYLVRPCDEELLVWRELTLKPPTREERLQPQSRKMTSSTIVVGPNTSLARLRLRDTARSIASLLHWEVRG